jgi:hypothetical protein
MPDLELSVLSSPPFGLKFTVLGLYLPRYVQADGLPARSSRCLIGLFLYTL